MGLYLLLTYGSPLGKSDLQSLVHSISPLRWVIWVVGHGLVFSLFFGLLVRPVARSRAKDGRSAIRDAFLLGGAYGLFGPVLASIACVILTSLARDPLPLSGGVLPVAILVAALAYVWGIESLYALLLRRATNRYATAAVKPKLGSHTQVQYYVVLLILSVCSSLYKTDALMLAMALVVFSIMGIPPLLWKHYDSIVASAGETDESRLATEDYRGRALRLARTMGVYDDVSYVCDWEYGGQVFACVAAHGYEDSYTGAPSYIIVDDLLEWPADLDETHEIEMRRTSLGHPENMPV